jgi:hypothetical protein
MSSLQKRKRQRRAHKAWRKQVHEVSILANKIGFYLIEGHKMRKNEAKQGLSHLAHRADWSSDFYLRPLSKPPFDIVIEGNLSNVKIYLDRLWRLKAFL